jgi:hypothetical protein
VGSTTKDGDAAEFPRRPATEHKDAIVEKFRQSGHRKSFVNPSTFVKLFIPLFQGWKQMPTVAYCVD